MPTAAPLYPDLVSLGDTAYMKAIQAETGAMVMGRRSFAMAGDRDSYADTYEVQAPTFVVTHEPPTSMPKRKEAALIHLRHRRGRVRGLTGGRRRGRQHRHGDRRADVIRRLLDAGLVDELRIDVMPVLLCGGRRLFDGVALEKVLLEKLDVEEVGVRTSLNIRVVR